MDEVLGATWLVSPLGLAMIACVAIGFAVTARSKICESGWLSTTKVVQPSRGSLRSLLKRESRE
ncbi:MULTISPECIES: hypothetical protein [Sorangium]|uniref:hypothetical protein n=1 Tax=Sorangium TaxID=39643 RepID=UPI003D9C0F6B